MLTAVGVTGVYCYYQEHDYPGSRAGFKIRDLYGSSVDQLAELLEGLA